MFRSISTVTKRRKDYFKNKTKDDEKIDSALEEFFNRYFFKEKELLKKEVEAIISGNNLIINCSNKIIANELIMKSRELAIILKEKDLILDKIIIK